ncbi:hypothetical protein KZ483_11790 [Paenibacillus sp. sptzw28]|uniref:ATP-binding protein n=1 Tax=Paenibacillus sp. sptzw28 TaxID=715179 RepID=UPI001C6E6B61|nr:hypothetical protein [Paenibacillus sp. sptzw28]QYR23530.1 hypothetical protein KZ483_11790 [Paenibacillus sp. sptzw28]
MREPEAALAALLAANPAAGPGLLDAPGSRSGRPAVFHPEGGSKAHAAQQAAMQAYMQEAAATSSADRKPAFIHWLRALIDARLDELLFSEHRLNARQELSRRLMRFRSLEAERQAAAAEAAGRADAVAVRWRGWLADRALPTSLSPEAAMETFDLAEQGMMRLQARDRIAEKSAVLGSEVGLFETAVKSLHASFPAAHGGSGSGDMAVALKLFKAELLKHTAARSRSEELNEKLAQLNLQALTQEAALDRLYSRQQQWFDIVEAEGETRWLEAIEQSERLCLIDSKLYKLDAQLTAGVSALQRERITQWYEEFDAHQLELMKSEAEIAYSAEEERRSVLLEQSGRQRQRLEQLMRDNDRRRLIGEREQTTAALEQLMHRYAVMSVAMTMIKRTKRIMEEQRQPAVLREASRYLNSISGGKYIRISVQHGEQRIRLETADGQSVDSIFLSRGTAEQLYLSMRFALADEAAATADLPMILDDLFVNFDRPRLEGAIHVLKELSSRRQLVLLTCHDHVCDLLAEKLPGAELVRLS